MSTELAGVGGAVRVEVGLVSEAVSCLLKPVLFIAEMLNREAKRPKKSQVRCDGADWTHCGGL